MKIEDLFDKSGNISSAKLVKFKDSPDLPKLYEHITFLPDHVSVAERLYCAFHNMSGYPKCSCGNNITHFRTFRNGYGTHCSISCSSKSGAQKRINSCLEKYGTRFATQSLQVKNKSKQTCLDRYGVESVTLHPEMQRKSKQTCLTKYGVKNISQTEFVKDKVRTARENGAYDNVKYSEKRRNTLYKENPNYILLSSKSWLQNEYKNSNIVQIAEKIGVAFSTVNNYLISHNIDRDQWTFRSAVEIEIQQFLTELGIPFVANDRTIIAPRELDVFIPSHNLAIEYNGTFWHSVKSLEQDTEMSKKYHLQKTIDAEEKNINLLHIFDTEWKEKKEIWKSVIRHKLNMSNKIYARKCVFALVPAAEGKEFVEKNHLQGSTIGGTYYGLYYNNSLVSVMQIGKSRFSKKYDYEIFRYCCALNTSAVGGFSKLLKNSSISGNIVSYANRKWSSGDLYRTNNFIHINNSIPNYYYVKNGVVESRIKYQKHKLSQLLELYDSQLSETENMFNNGFCKVYDSGNMVFSLVV